MTGLLSVGWNQAMTCVRVSEGVLVAAQHVGRRATAERIDEVIVVPVPRGAVHVCHGVCLA